LGGPALDHRFVTILTTEQIAAKLARYSRPNPGTGCIEWQRGGANGYGQICVGDGAVRPAHRVAYEVVHGPVDQALHVDHLCRNRRCINVQHLEAVTPRENALRGIGPAAQNARKTHCKNGHELAPPNLIAHPTARLCKTCIMGRKAEKRRQEGAKQFRPRLTDEVALEILHAYDPAARSRNRATANSTKDLARRYGLTASVVQALVTGKRYKHLPRPFAREVGQ
jgi:hypothetical protein